MTNEADPRELRIVREVAAAQAAVWRAFTTPALLERWWGPTGFRTETHTHDLRPGGAWRMTMHGPDGQAYANFAVFEEVREPDRLKLHYVDEHGGAALHDTEITLEPLGPTRTRVVLSLWFASAEALREVVERYGALEGGRQTLGRLAELVEAGEDAADAAFVVRRVLAATEAQVWAAWTSAAHLQRWFHPEVWSITECTLELRVGGRFHYAFEGEGLPRTWARWTFLEVEPPHRLCFDLAFSDADGEPAPSPFPGPWPAVSRVEVRIEPHAGIGRGVVLTVRVVPVAPRDDERAAFVAAMGSMGQGWGQTLDSLAVFLSSGA